MTTTRPTVGDPVSTHDLEAARVLTETRTELARVRSQRDRAVDLADTLLGAVEPRPPYVLDRDVDAWREQLARLRRMIAGTPRVGDVVGNRGDLEALADGTVVEAASSAYRRAGDRWELDGAGGSVGTGDVPLPVRVRALTGGEQR